MFQIYLIRSEETRRLGALEVGDYSTSDTNDVIRVCTEVVVPRSRSRPHLVVLQQVGVYENTQLSAVTKGRHADDGLPPAIQFSLTAFGPANDSTGISTTAFATVALTAKPPAISTALTAIFLESFSNFTEAT